MDAEDRHGRTRPGGRGQVLGAVALVLLGACGGGGGGGSTSTPASPPAPVITGFAVTKPVITNGTSTTLTASYMNGTGVINSGVGNVATGVPVTVSPTADTTYTLTVTNSAGVAAYSSTSVSVVPPPAVPAITAPPSVVYNQVGYTASVPIQPNATYAWTIQGGSITSGGGTHQVTFTAGASGTVQLGCMATNLAGTPSAAGTASIPILVPPVISSFTGTPIITAGSGATLSWTVSGAATLSLDQALGDVTGLTSKTVSPTARTTYQLTATNAAGAVSAQATVDVAAPPVIVSFRAGTPEFDFMTGTTLTAVFTGGTGVVQPGNQPIVSGQPLAIQRHMASRYELTVTNAANSEVKTVAAVRPRNLPLSAGYETSFAKMADGNIWAWGANNYAQLGATGRDTSTPVFQTTLPGYRCVAAEGWGDSYGLKADGTVWGWGANSGTTPRQVTGLSNVVALAPGYNFSMALKADGTVWTWGDNAEGELGNGTTTGSTTPVQALGLTSVISISTMNGHALALKSDGTVWSWGYNSEGELGNGGTSMSALPAQVAGLPAIVAIAAGGFSSYALAKDGTVWSWGYNGNGELGQGNTQTELVPGPISGLADMVAIAAGGQSAWALGKDGALWTWGINRFGQLGLGHQTNVLTPTRITAISDAVAVDGGWTHTLVLQRDGTLRAFGWNASGELGDGSPLQQPLPISSPIPGVSALGAAGFHTVALKGDGTLLSWGHNGGGRLGDGTLFDRSVPGAVPGFGSTAAVAAGTYHTLALKADGTVWTWGTNNKGQLGLGTTTASLSPTQVPGLSGIVSVGAGLQSSYAVRNDGTVWSWGWNANGQLGLGSTTDALSPLQVPGIHTARAVAAGDKHALILCADGTVLACGYNGMGQLGDGTNNQQLSPVAVVGLSGITRVACGGNHSLAQSGGYQVYAWGNNDSGQLGLGTSGSNSVVPTLLPGFSSVTDLGAGYNHSMVLRSDGSVWTWGNNADGQLGLGLPGSLPSALQPTQALPPGSANVISAGRFQSFAYGSGLLWAWGHDNTGQLGLGRTIVRSQPYGISAPVLW